MQSAYQLQQLGAVIYVTGLVAVSITRELGPVLTALVVGRQGRCGNYRSIGQHESKRADRILRNHGYKSG